ncbi:MAG: HIT domain-containing protein [bacterium]
MTDSPRPGPPDRPDSDLHDVEEPALGRLWATWRMSYISSLKDGTAAGDVFSELPRRTDGPENLIVHRGQHCYVVLNLFPYNTGHALIVPFREVGDLAELTDAEMLELMRLASVVVKALRRCMNAQGFNLGINLGHAAGAGIPKHLHLHVVPRWAGDTNFMAVTGRTKVLPESLPDTYDKMRRAIRAELGLD